MDIFAVVNILKYKSQIDYCTFAEALQKLTFQILLIIQSFSDLAWFCYCTSALVLCDVNVRQ